MRVSRVGDSRDHGVKDQFERRVAEDDSPLGAGETVKVLFDDSLDYQFMSYCGGVRLAADGVPEINGSGSCHKWRYDLNVSDLCVISRAIRKKIQNDKTGRWAKHFAPLIGEFAETAATAIEGIRSVEDDDDTQ